MARSENLGDQVYHKLKRKIVSSELAPGTYLDEVHLCGELGVSRTPVREALVRLEEERLVVSFPRRGIMVTEQSMSAILELFHIRKVMEPELLKPCLVNYDRESLLAFRKKFETAVQKKEFREIKELHYQFHQYLNEKCEKRHVARLMGYVTDHFQRILTQRFYAEEALLKGAEDHIQMIDALLGKRYDDMIQILRDDISNMEKEYRQEMMSDFNRFV